MSLFGDFFIVLSIIYIPLNRNANEGGPSLQAQGKCQQYSVYSRTHWDALGKFSIQNKPSGIWCGEENFHNVNSQLRIED